MMNARRKVFKAAMLLRWALLDRQPKPEDFCLPSSAWEAVESLASRITRARSRGWNLAAALLLQQLRFEVQCCRDRLGDFAGNLQPDANSQAVPSSNDLIREVFALENEFVEVSIDLDEAEIAVTTEHVVLEGIELGPFKICLQLDRIFASSPYRVIALDRNPAASDSSVTHPHVQAEHLCEGDGQAAIAAALKQGRLLDFFLIVNRLLHTYAAGSAYVELDAWHGEPCRSCGYMADDGKLSYCQRCDDNLCDELGGSPALFFGRISIGLRRPLRSMSSAKSWSWRPSSSSK